MVSLNLYGPDGGLAKQVLKGTLMAAGEHSIEWDGTVDGHQLPPGDYTWSAVIHDDFVLKLRGWVGDWGGNRGVPSAATALNDSVFLGWSLSTSNAASVVACDSNGSVRWSHHRGPISGCRALAADAGMVYVLGGEADDAEGGSLYRLAAKDGALVPWPDGRIDLKVASLWPADGKPKPCLADYLAVKNGRIYLSFPSDEFAAVLDAKTGAYLQTLVGAPPGAIDSVATKSDTPENPDQLVDADFVVTALKGGVIGKILLVHDPIWVVASDLTPLERNERISALTMIGDGAKHHQHDIFVALGFPFNQVQARSALKTESFSYVAGQKGGRPPQGAWQADRMSVIRAVALDGEGQLWVAEGASVPKRISVWSTDSSEGRLVREFFAPPDSASPVAINPSDPFLIYAGGCEWRVDATTGRAACLGIISQEPMRAAWYIMEKDRVFLVLTPMTGAELVFERSGDGEYRPVASSAPAAAAVPPKLKLHPMPGGAWAIESSDGYVLGTVFNRAKAIVSAPLSPPSGNDWPLLSKNVGTPTLTQMPDGKVFLTAGLARIWNLELNGIKTLRPLGAGKVTIPKRSR